MNSRYAIKIKIVLLLACLIFVFGLWLSSQSKAKNQKVEFQPDSTTFYTRSGQKVEAPDKAVRQRVKLPEAPPPPPRVYSIEETSKVSEEMARRLYPDDELELARTKLGSDLLAATDRGKLAPDFFAKPGLPSTAVEQAQKHIDDTRLQIQSLEIKNRVLTQQIDGYVSFDVLPFSDQLADGEKGFWGKMETLVGRQMASFLYGAQFSWGREFRGFGKTHWRYKVAQLNDVLWIQTFIVEPSGNEKAKDSMRTPSPGSSRFGHLVDFE